MIGSMVLTAEVASFHPSVCRCMDTTGSKSPNCYDRYGLLAENHGSEADCCGRGAGYPAPLPQQISSEPRKTASRPERTKAVARRTVRLGCFVSYDLSLTCNLCDQERCQPRQTHRSDHEVASDRSPRHRHRTTPRPHTISSTPNTLSLSSPHRPTGVSNYLPIHLARPANG